MKKALFFGLFLAGIALSASVQAQSGNTSGANAPAKVVTAGQTTSENAAVAPAESSKSHCSPAESKSCCSKDKTAGKACCSQPMKEESKEEKHPEKE